MVYIISLYENAMTDIMIEKTNDKKKTKTLLIFKKINIIGIVPIIDDNRIFLKLVILVNNILTPTNIT